MVRSVIRFFSSRSFLFLCLPPFLPVFHALFLSSYLARQELGCLFHQSVLHAPVLGTLCHRVLIYGGGKEGRGKVS